MDKTTLDKIDLAIDRLRAKFDNPTANHALLAISIANLHEKRQRIVDGTYKPDEDAERLCAMFSMIGRGICTSVKARESWYGVNDG